MSASVLQDVRFTDVNRMVRISVVSDSRSLVLPVGTRCR